MLLQESYEFKMVLDFLKYLKFPRYLFEIKVFFKLLSLSIFFKVINEIKRDKFIFTNTWPP